MVRKFEIIGPSVGTLLSAPMGIGLERGYISIEFYSDGSFSEIVRPTFGTVTFRGSENNTSFSSINNAIVAAAITGPSGKYTWPTFSGPVAFIQVTFANITGATHAKVFITKYGEL